VILVVICLNLFMHLVVISVKVADVLLVILLWSLEMDANLLTEQAFPPVGRSSQAQGNQGQPSFLGFLDVLCSPSRSR